MKIKQILRTDLILYLYGAIFFSGSMLPILPTVDFQLYDTYYVLRVNSIFLGIALITITMGLIYTYLISKSKRPNRFFLILFLILITYPLLKLMALVYEFIVIGGFSRRYYTLTVEPEPDVLPALISFILAVIFYVLSLIWSKRT